MKKLLLKIFGMMLLSMGLVFAVSRSALYFMEKANAGRQAMYYVSLVSGLCGLMLFALLLNIFVIRRLKKLSYGVNEVAKGNYDITVKDAGKDELEGLAKDFNRMTSELKANEYLSREFVKNVSHELKTPLAAVTGYAQLLLNQSLTKEEIAEYSAIILQEAKRLSGMGSQMLSLSKLDSAVIVKKDDEVDLAKQISKIILSMQTVWLGKNIDLQADLDEIIYKTNEEMAWHIWQNLIGNAIKFCNDGGVVAVKVKRQDSALMFSVSNTGECIKAEDAPQIFSQFFTSSPSKGSGLGLPIAKKITEKLGGEIYFTSQEGKTEFTVKLPL